MGEQRSRTAALALMPRAMSSLCVFAVLLLLLNVFADAQTLTVVLNGVSIVEVITQNANGIPTTSIVSTILPTPTSTTTSSTGTSTSPATSTTSTTRPLGPVEQPSSITAPGGDTPYEYTTTDANGNTVVEQGIFTPTGPQSVLPIPTTTGTILSYSQWLSIVGTNTSPANAASRMSTPVSTGWFYFAATAFAGLLGGAWLVVVL